MMIRPGKINLLAAALTLLLAACGEQPASTAASAMKVNGTAIGAAEVAGKLEQYAHLPDAQKQAVTRTILNALADSELLRQAALAERLDADPAIQARLNGVNRLILTNAYIEKKMAALEKPSEAEIKRHYERHPERYAKRKSFDLHELVILGGRDRQAEVEAYLADVRKADELLTWLQNKKIPHHEQQRSVGSDQMLAPVLEKLRAARGGEVIRLPAEDKLTILFVNGVQIQPLTLAAAAPMIEEQLLEARKGKRMDELMQSLRDKAKIEYLPPYTADNSPSQP